MPSAPAKPNSMHSAASATRSNSSLKPTPPATGRQSSRPRP